MGTATVALRQECCVEGSRGTGGVCGITCVCVCLGRANTNIGRTTVPETILERLAILWIHVEQRYT